MRRSCTLDGTPALLLLTAIAATILVSCGARQAAGDKGAVAATAAVSAVPVQPAAGTQTIQTAASVGRDGVLAAAVDGERQLQARQMLSNNDARRMVLPEDYERGYLASGADATGALAATREFFAALKTGNAQAVLASGAGLLSAQLGENQALFSTMQTVRILAPVTVEGDYAAVPVRVLGMKSSAEFEVYLERDPEGPWKIADLQGNPGRLAEERENRYTGYLPQDVERKLIREGTGKPWL